MNATAWAICDTDGGRIQPKPLLRRLYESEAIAIATRAYLGFDPQWYPICKVEIKIL